MYREEAKTKCPACQRTVAAVKEYNYKYSLLGKLYEEGLHILVSRHLYQEGTETNGLGLPELNADGFCPGSLNPVKE
jgi:hypothetical protein